MLKNSPLKRTSATAGRPAIRDAELDAALWQVADAQDRLALADSAVVRAEAAKSAAVLEVARAEQALEEWRVKRVAGLRSVNAAPAEMRSAA